MRFLLLAFIGMLLTNLSNAQIQLKAEYIGSSKYRDADNQKTGGKGDAAVLSGFVQLPLYMKMDSNNRPTVWGVGISANYTSFDNKHMPKELCPSEMLSGQLSLMHMRPMGEKWSLLAAAGAGFYTAHTNMSDITMKNILGHGAIGIVWHLRENLDLGAGLAVNTSFGYPMAFPAFYVNWKLEGKYEVNVEMMNAFEVSAGMKINNHLKLYVSSSVNGSLALEKVNGKDMMFTHQYIVAGLKPEFRFGQFSIPVTLGITAARQAYYEERTLKAFFKAMSREYDPYFGVAPYVSISLRYGF